MFYYGYEQENITSMVFNSTNPSTKQKCLENAFVKFLNVCFATFYEK